MPILNEKQLLPGTVGQVLQIVSGGPGGAITSWEDQAKLAVGSATAPSYSFSTDTELGFYRVGSDSSGGIMGMAVGSFNPGSTLAPWTWAFGAQSGVVASATVADDPCSIRLYRSMQPLPTTVSSNAHLGSIETGGYNGSSYVVSTRILTIATDTFSGSAYGASMQFSTVVDGGTTLTERMSIGSDGNIDLSANMRAQDGSEGTPSISMKNDSDTGFFLQGTNAIGMSSAGSEVARLGSTGIQMSSSGTASAPALSVIGDTELGFYRVGADSSGGIMGMAVGSFDPGSTLAPWTWAFGIQTGVIGSNTAGDACLLRLYRARNAPFPSAVTTDGDNLSRIITGGYSGSSYLHSADILTQATESYATAGNGGRMIFRTVATGGTTLTERMRLDDDGGVEMPNSSASVSSANAIKIRSNGGTFQVSENGAAYVDVQTGSSISGTTNVIAKFTSSTGIGDSSLTDDGSDVTSTIPFHAPDGSVSAPSFAFSGETNSGMYRGTNILAFSLTGNKMFEVDDQGGQFTYTDDGAAGPILKLFHNTDNAANNDIVGQYQFLAPDDGATTRILGAISAEWTDVTASGGSSSELNFEVRDNATGVGTNTTATLSSSGVWTDAPCFLAEKKFISGFSFIDKVKQMNVGLWRKVGQSDGPVNASTTVEDMYNLFGIGDDPSSSNYRGGLAARDMAGVALATIKELIDENEKLKLKNIDLENRIIALESAA